MRESIVTIPLLALFCVAGASGADKSIVTPPGAKPSGSYSQGILIGDTLYISGQGGEDPTGKIPREFDAEVLQSLENIGAILKAGGMSPANVVSVQVYLTDAAKFQKMNAVYASYFKEPRPTRTTVVVAALVGPGSIEITATAVKIGARRGSQNKRRIQVSDVRNPVNHEAGQDDPLESVDALQKAPEGVDRRAFLMRNALIGATAILVNRPVSAQQRADRLAGTPPAPALSPSLNVVKESKGPIMTTLDEFYKVGPGPSSSHTIGPMRITYDFYQRCTKLPADKLSRATALKVHLFGSLSATGKGHGTERASLAGLVGKEPATVDPAFLDSLRDQPDQSFPVKLGPKTVDVTLKDVVFDATDGNFPHPNTMTVKLMAGNTVLLEQEYYSVGGGFIEWKGYKPPQKNPPKYPFATMKELRQHAEQNNLSIAEVMLANEMSIPGRTEDEVYAFIDKITGAMVAIVKAGLDAPEGVLPGPIKLQTKAGTVFKRAQDDQFQSDRGIGTLSAYALAGLEENARGHLVVTAPTGGSAGVMPALVYGLGEGGRKLSQDQIRKGMLAAAAIGYLCKHNATLSAAEGGCQAEIGVASAMAAALIAAAYDASPRVLENAAESALEHHLGMTCDPVAGYVQVPCIERCAFGAVKAWTAWAIASNEIESRHRIDLDATITAMAQTAKDMNSKYKETSQAGLALSVTLC